ncbi:MAG: flagellar basal body-associated FliL family protein [Holophaga sp.]|nr:flagellar basal body-associated FliL family protein [Holophaga sp.]
MKKKILMAVIALIVLCVLGGGGFVGYKWFTGRKAQAAPEVPLVQAKAGAGQDDDEDEPEAGGGDKEGAPAAPAVLQLKGLIVNLDSTRKTAFLRCELDVLFRDPDLGRAATSEKPTPENSVIRSIVLESISGKTVDEASDVETRESIRQEIKDKLNDKFANHRSKEVMEKARKSGKPLKPPIKDVLVVDWAIQQ